MRKKNPRFRIGLVVIGSCSLFVGLSVFIVGSSLKPDGQIDQPISQSLAETFIQTARS